MGLKQGQNLVITGLPRSGTSFLCARINDFRNTVVINEPAEIFAEAKGGNIEGLAKVFAQFRRDITQGKPVYNKIKDGKFIEDTRLEDNRRLHQHIVENEQFMLGIKNTLVFLAMLPEIVQSKAFPKVIATIRHPYDCIGSWHNVEFPHLKQAKPGFLFDYAGAAFTEGLSEVLDEEELIARSAKLWALLAQTLLNMKGKVHVTRYEDLVLKPDKSYQAMSKYLGTDESDVHLPEPSNPVRRRDVFSDEQKSVITSLCNKPAARYGYKLN